jgi:hypothetical protein
MDGSDIDEPADGGMGVELGMDVGMEVGIGPFGALGVLGNKPKRTTPSQLRADHTAPATALAPSATSPRIETAESRPEVAARSATGIASIAATTTAVARAGHF